MVERTVCSTGEETRTNSGGSSSSVKSSNVITSSGNDRFVVLSTENAENVGRARGFQIVLEPELETSHDTSRLDSNRPSAVSGGSTGTNRFSLFKWFKRGSRESTSASRGRKIFDGTSSPDEEEIEDRGTCGSSSTESVDTFYSTATVRSFAFHSGTLRSGEENSRNAREPTSLDLINHTQRKVGPFGAGAAKLVVKKENRSREESTSDVARTLPANVLSKRRDITARYSLQTCAGFGSCGNFGGSQRGLSGSLRRLDDRVTGRRVHVRGKRRAPNPPGLSTGRSKAAITEDAKLFRGTGRKKRRPAPKPPERNSGISNCEVKVNNEELETTGIEFGGKNGDETESKKFEEIVAGWKVKIEGHTGATASVTRDCTISETENDKVTETTRNVPRSNDSESTTNLISGTSSTLPVESNLSEGSSCDLSQSISNDTLVLQGGVLHSKKIRDSDLTLKKSATNVSSETFDRDAIVGSPFGRIAIKTGSQTSAMPRPWYKRSVFEHSRDTGSSKRGDVLRNPPTHDVRDETNVCNSNVGISGSSSSPKTHRVDKSHSNEGGTLSRLNFFHRGNDKTADERKKENKRKSGLSILTNISELDKEAAAIVQEEQARTRAASMLLQASRIDELERRNDQINEEVVQDIVTSAMESSPRRGTRALISKFNAIGNITRVTVNSSFFSKSTYAKEHKEETSGVAQNDDWRTRTQFSGSERSPNVKVEKDLSRYFLHQQSSTKIKTNNDDEEKLAGSESPKNSRASANISTRLSFLQGTTTKTNDSFGEATREPAISRFTGGVVARAETDKESENVENKNSPKLSRLRVRVVNSDIVKTNVSEASDRRKLVGDNVVRDLDDIVAKKKVETVQKEFSSIFNEINEKLNSKKFGDSVETGRKDDNKQEPGTSSQVSRVLDILVEAEKSDKLKSNYPKTKDNETITTNSDNSDKLGKWKNPRTVENPMKMDLREMLKEMKHSLPKRPKAKKLSANSEKPVKSEKELCEDTKDVKSSMEDRQVNPERLMNTVTVIYPPPIRIGPPADVGTKKNGAANEERDCERQKKVSSAAQTSGNVRKLGASAGPSSGSSKWKEEDVVYRTSGKGVATPGTSGGLVKNTFQLIRPREFAQIEAIKTLRTTKGENTYANVIERESLYANALVPVPKKVPQGLPAGPRKEETKSTKNAASTSVDSVAVKKSSDNEATTASSETNDEAQDVRPAVDQHNMNTLAVNRLLRKLEAAIASGHHQQAAGLAKELARLKIHCSVVRQRTKAKDVINVNMYIEDKLAHQGPIPLRLARSMTVAQLKAKVFTEFEIPTNVQRWIVGKNLADDDATTLEGLQAAEGSPVFLYLVAPELKVDEPSGRVEQVPVVDDLPHEEPDPKPTEEVVTVVAVDDQSQKEQTEPQSVKEDNEVEDECISEEVRMERYEALISLENCDVIPNSEPIECPICFVTYGPQEGVILRDCLHMFCRPCIANTIRYCEEAEVKCPYRDTEYTCESTLQEREIKALVEPQVYQQHLAKSISQAENNAGNNAFHCKTPDCPGWCIYDDNVNNFLCPVCGANNCLTCQVVHTGKNCRQYQQELRFSKETDQESQRTAAMLEEMVDRGEALPCPTCAVVLMKKWGCDWLRCSMCKTEICWVTRGPRWGPGGKGDTSGGCRCGENGVKCHRRCNYCH